MTEPQPSTNGGTRIVDLITKFISAVGFPIAVAIYLLYLVSNFSTRVGEMQTFMHNALTQSTERHAQNVAVSTAMKAEVGENAEALRALRSEVQAMRQLLERQRGGQ
jgi:hypothetical protein